MFILKSLSQSKFQVFLVFLYLSAYLHHASASTVTAELSSAICGVLSNEQKCSWSACTPNDWSSASHGCGPRYMLCANPSKCTGGWQYKCCEIPRELASNGRKRSGIGVGVGRLMVPPPAQHKQLDFRELQMGKGHERYLGHNEIPEPDFAASAMWLWPRMLVPGHENGRLRKSNGKPTFNNQGRRGVDFRDSEFENEAEVDEDFVAVQPELDSDIQLATMKPIIH